MVAFKNKTVLYPLRKYIQQNLNHIETNQSICSSSQVADFFIKQASTEKYLQSGYNGICQGIKKKIIS